MSRYTIFFPLFLRLFYMKSFSLTFHFSIGISCLFPGGLVFFTSRMLSNNEHLFEYFCYFAIFIDIFLGPLLPTFIVLKYHINADSIACILLLDCQSCFRFLHPFWVFLKSYRVQIDTQICSTQFKQPTFFIHNTEKKIWH